MTLLGRDAWLGEMIGWVRVLHMSRGKDQVMAQDENSSRAAGRQRTARLPEGLVVGVLTLVLLVVIGIFVYRMSTRPARPEVAAADLPPVGRADERSPGGFDPRPTFRSTRDELEFRGAGKRPQGPMPGLGTSEPLTRLSEITQDRQPASGQRVELKDVEVDSANGQSFVIRDGDDTMVVVAPDGSPRVRRGDRVSVSGRVETSGSESRINATRVERLD